MPVCRQFIFSSASWAVILCGMRVSGSLLRFTDRHTYSANKVPISAQVYPMRLAKCGCTSSTINGSNNRWYSAGTINCWWGQDGESCSKLISGLGFNLFMHNDRSAFFQVFQVRLVENRSFTIHAFHAVSIIHKTVILAKHYMQELTFSGSIFYIHVFFSN